MLLSLAEPFFRLSPQICCTISRIHYGIICKKLDFCRMIIWKLIDKLRRGLVPEQSLGLLHVPLTVSDCRTLSPISTYLGTSSAGHNAVGHSLKLWITRVLTMPFDIIEHRKIVLKTLLYSHLTLDVIWIGGFVVLFYQGEYMYCLVFVLSKIYII